jgi:hypothetical protein
MEKMLGSRLSARGPVCDTEKEHLHDNKKSEFKKGWGLRRQFLKDHRRCSMSYSVRKRQSKPQINKTSCPLEARLKGQGRDMTGDVAQWWTPA